MLFLQSKIVSPTLMGINLYQLLKVNIENIETHFTKYLAMEAPVSKHQWLKSTDLTHPLPVKAPHARIIKIKIYNSHLMTGWVYG